MTDKEIMQKALDSILANNYRKVPMVALVSPCTYKNFKQDRIEWFKENNINVVSDPAIESDIIFLLPQNSVKGNHEK